MKIKLPQVGESVTEAVIEKWLVEIGDLVNKYDSLAEVVTDKVNMELPSPASGVVAKLFVKPGQTIEMGTVIAELTTDNDIETDEGGQGFEEISVAESPGMSDRTGVLLKDVLPVGPTGSGRFKDEERNFDDNREQPRHSPAVVKLANEHGVDLNLLEGSGIKGRITRKDVQQYINGLRKLCLGKQNAGTSKTDELLFLTPVRRMIAEKMSKSATKIPAAWTVVEADVTDLVKFRKGIKSDFQVREGVNLTYLPFVVKIVANALKSNPLVNASWSTDAIILKKRVNIGVAMAAPVGLLVPVIHDADDLSVPELASVIDDLSIKARDGKLNIDDMQGGTFTVNNTGVLGSVFGKALINYPEAAILNTEAIIRRPIVSGDAIVIRSIMNLCLTFDHRIMDGIDAGQFIGEVKAALESIDPTMVL